MRARPAARPSRSVASVSGLPERLSDKDYWKLETDISEPGGYFRIEDNYTSNEMEIGQLYAMLRDSHVAGDVYMGVGPEQNFTYIAAIRPKMAFIVDIRRQAIMQHLMFKAMFEMANDRADFISVLFGKPRPPGIDTSTSIQRSGKRTERWRATRCSRTRNYVRVVDRLTKTHGFTFTQDESDKLKAVFDAFYYLRPEHRDAGLQRARRRLRGSHRFLERPLWPAAKLSLVGGELPVHQVAP